GAKYVIFTTTMDSISAAANAIVAMNVSNVQFSDIQNRIMTESGVIDVKLPDGTVRKTRTEAERDKLLDGKFDKAGGLVEGGVTAVALGSTRKQTNSTIYLYPAPESSPDGYAYFQYKIGDRWFGRVEIPRPENGNTRLMQVGDYGIGISLPQSSTNFTSTTLGTGFYATPGGTGNPWGNNGSAHIVNVRDGNYGFQIGRTTGNMNLSFRTLNAGAFSAISTIYSTANTTKDSNGNLKAASPIIKVFADHIELNEESEGVELEKLGTGRYKLKGVLGMNSDASWGGIHGGMVIPNGINNLPLVWGSFDVLPDGDIIIETRYRKHELNERQEAERLMTYPEFLKDELVEVDTEEGKKEKLLKVEREDYEYCDIPNGHWIDVRVNMPSNSIYNLKQAEAERLAKEAAEKQAEEDAKRAAEEAERVESEVAQTGEQ
nr:hypothetical protein [Providencia stuartii]